MMASSNLEKISAWVKSTQIYKAVFRHGYEDTPRNRSLTTFSNVLYHLHPVKTRWESIKIRYTWCMGGISLLFFVMLAVTGVLLMFYYVPDVRRAYQDIKDMMTVVSYGTTFRNIHRFAAQGMVATVWIHMTRVFLTGSYKSPREFNWVIGVVLLVLTLLLSFTGYLLPWDQLSMWAVTVGTNMARATPFFGHEGPFGADVGVTARYDARSFLLGGSLVGPPALLRFYVLHCIFIPIAASLLMILHFWRI